MSLILHHALKDLRAGKWLVAAWAAMLLTLGAVDLLQPGLSLGERVGRLPSSNSAAYAVAVAAIARVLLSWFIAVRIVHADPLDSTEAFWLTRPISLRALFAAKAGLIGVLFVAFPGVLVGAVLLGVGVPVSAVPALTVRWLLPELVLLLPIVLVATLTRDLARIVLSLAVVLAAWLLIQLAIGRLSVEVSYADLDGGRDAIATAWSGTPWAVAVAAAALIAWHYLTRQRRNTALAAGAACLVCAGLAWAWPVQLMIAAAQDTKPSSSRIQEWHGDGRLGVELVADSLRSGTRQAGSVDGVSGEIRVTGLPDGVVFDAMNRGRATLSFPGAEPFHYRDMYWRGIDTFPGVTQSEDNRRVVERVIGARLIDDPVAKSSRGWSGAELMELPAASYSRYQDTPGRYDADLDFIARRVSVAAAVPFVRGASAHLGDVQTRILDIRQQSVSFTTGGARRFFVVALRTSVPRTLSIRTPGRTGCLLLNRRRGEAVPLANGGGLWPLARVGTLAALAVVSMDSVLIHPIGGEFESPEQARWLDKSWLADAELVFLSSDVLGKFTRHVSVPDFRLPELYIKGDGLPAAGGR